MQIMNEPQIFKRIPNIQTNPNYNEHRMFKDDQISNETQTRNKHQILKEP